MPYAIVDSYTRQRVPFASVLDLEAEGIECPQALPARTPPPRVADAFAGRIISGEVERVRRALPDECRLQLITWHDYYTLICDEEQIGA